MTCFAVCAAMRPMKSSGTGSSCSERTSPVSRSSSWIQTRIVAGLGVELHAGAGRLLVELGVVLRASSVLYAEARASSRPARIVSNGMPFSRSSSFSAWISSWFIRHTFSPRTSPPFDGPHSKTVRADSDVVEGDRPLARLGGDPSRSPRPPRRSCPRASGTRPRLGPKLHLHLLADARGRTRSRRPQRPLQARRARPRARTAPGRIPPGPAAGDPLADRGDRRRGPRRPPDPRSPEGSVGPARGRTWRRPTPDPRTPPPA